MPNILGFDVALVMEGTRLEEYGVQESEESGIPVVTCWVPSEAGKV